VFGAGVGELVGLGVTGAGVGELVGLGVTGAGVGLGVGLAVGLGVANKIPLKSVEDTAPVDDKSEGIWYEGEFV